MVYVRRAVNSLLVSAPFFPDVGPEDSTQVVRL